MALQPCIPPPVLALIAAGMMWLLTRYAPAVPVAGPLWTGLGWVLITLGLGADLASLAGFVRARTTVSPLKVDRSRVLIVTGLYRVSRNPMYLGLVLVLAGWSLLLGNLLCLLLVWAFARVLNVWQIAPEEAALRARFGQAYAEYASQVNRWVGRHA